MSIALYSNIVLPSNTSRFANSCHSLFSAPTGGSVDNINMNFISITSNILKSIEIYRNHTLLMDDSSNNVKNVRIAAAEMGFLATTLLLGPVELLARTVVGIAINIILFPCGVIYQRYFNHNNNNPLLIPVGIVTFGVIFSALVIPQSAISLYTNIAHQNEVIDYAGQARSYLLGGVQHVEEPE
jgi:hypothetical protein